MGTFDWVSTLFRFNVFCFFSSSLSPEAASSFLPEDFFLSSQSRQFFTWRSPCWKWGGLYFDYEFDLHLVFSSKRFRLGNFCFNSTSSPLSSSLSPLFFLGDLQPRSLLTISRMSLGDPEFSEDYFSKVCEGEALSWRSCFSRLACSITNLVFSTT